MVTLVDVVYVVVGAATVSAMLDAAVRTFVLPRGVPVRLTRLVSNVILRVFRAVAVRSSSAAHRDRVMAMYGPIALMAYPIVWIAGTLVGFMFVYRGLAVDTWTEAFRISGSSLLTLGFAVTSDSLPLVLEFLEATIGLGLVALLIAYLPTIYSSFSRREAFVTKMAVRAGTPPSPVELLSRAHLAGFLGNLDDVWTEAETWFIDLEETHTSMSILAFFRSPNGERSWVTTAGALLDGAALRLAVLNIPWNPQPALCIRSGYLSLTAVARHFGHDVPTHPSPTDPVSVTKEEFMEAYESLGERGVPVRPDREAAWNDYRGWRVNYDAALVALCDLTLAPSAMWSGDRVAGVGS